MTCSFTSESLLRFVSGGGIDDPYRRFLTLVIGFSLIYIYHHYPLLTHISSLVCVVIHRSAVNCPRTPLCRPTTSSSHLLFFFFYWLLFNAMMDHFWAFEWVFSQREIAMGRSRIGTH